MAEIDKAKLRRAIVNRGMVVPVVEYDDGSQGWGVPGLIMEPIEAWQRLQAGAGENVARMQRGLPFDPQSAGDAFAVTGAAAMGSAVPQAARALAGRPQARPVPRVLDDVPLLEEVAPGHGFGSAAGTPAANWTPFNRAYARAEDSPTWPSSWGDEASHAEKAAFAEKDYLHNIWREQMNARWSPDWDRPMIEREVMDAYPGLGEAMRKADTEFRRIRKGLPEGADPWASDPYAWFNRPHDLGSPDLAEADVAREMANSLRREAGMAKAVGLRGPDRAKAIQNVLSEFEVFANPKESAALSAAIQGEKQAGAFSSHLPMDEASRMARAKEMGFDLPMYHSTGADFQEFKPSYRGASFFADSPEAASRGASYGSQDWYGMRGNRSESIMPVMLRSQYIKGLNLAPKEIEWWNALPAVTDEAGLDAAMNSQPFHNIDYWWRVFDEIQNTDGSYSYVKKAIPSKTLDDVRSTGENVYGSKYIGTYEGEQGAARLAKEQGMDGFILEDEAGISVGIVDPTRIRSKFAAFDPAKADSADLLAANPKEAAALGAAVQGEKQGIRAYHGSPYDFDRFDISKMGSGEGAQAYGPGLYFAEAEDVARNYRDNLQPMASQARDNPDNLMRTAFSVGRDAAGALQYLESEWRKWGYDRPQNDLQTYRAAAMREAIERIKGGETAAKNRKTMYEVRINADPEDFLDWDAPVNTQPPKVQEALRSMLGEHLWDEHPGKTAYRDATITPGIGHENVAQRLRDADIPGIKYLDQGSRTAGEGSRNYVVFDDSLISIVKKYGIAGAASLYGVSELELMEAMQEQGL